MFATYWSAWSALEIFNDRALYKCSLNNNNNNNSETKQLSPSSK